MAARMSNEAKISIKVLVDKENNRVVYAVADHNFVDILFSFVTLPLGTIVRVLEKNNADKKFEAVGSLNNLYQSLVDLPESYLSTEEGKFMLLNPRSSSYDRCRKLKLNIDDTEPTKYFICEESMCNSSFNSPKFSTCNMARCGKCAKLMVRELRVKVPTASADSLGGGGVFVSHTTSFIVTDDLCVMPYSPGCCIQLLIDLGITDTSRLEERAFDLDRQQMIYLLRLALSFESPLTYLVLQKTLPIRDLDAPCIFDDYSLNKKHGSTSGKMSLEVSLQKSTGKLLFAEAEEDVVDFLFSFLAIPLGAVIDMLVNETGLVGMENIYKSISKMSEGRYLTSKDIKHVLLKPDFGQPFSSKNKLFPFREMVSSVYLAYTHKPGANWWESSFLTFSSVQGGYLIEYKDPRVNSEYLKRSGMFMITDDLVITPSSSISTMDILMKLKVPLNDIERQKFSFGFEEGLRMLNASLTSWATLTKGLGIKSRS